MLSSIPPLNSRQVTRMGTDLKQANNLRDLVQCANSKQGDMGEATAPSELIWNLLHYGAPTDSASRKLSLQRTHLKADSDLASPEDFEPAAFSPSDRLEHCVTSNATSNDNNLAEDFMTPWSMSGGSTYAKTFDFAMPEAFSVLEGDIWMDYGQL